MVSLFTTSCLAGKPALNSPRDDRSLTDVPRDEISSLAHQSFGPTVWPGTSIDCLPENRHQVLIFLRFAFRALALAGRRP